MGLFTKNLTCLGALQDYYSHWIAFSERILRYCSFYLELSFTSMSALELKFTVFLEPISFLALGNLVFKNLRTLGHLMDSTMLISPPLTLYPSLSIF